MSHKLLLADDSVTIQRVIELTFADEDVQVVAVGDGRQAIDRIAAERPDVVLADVGMPGSDGYEVCAFVKRTPDLAHIPVLLLTGAFEPVDDARAAACRCDGVLAKPFEPQQLIAKVKDLLRRPPHAESVPEPDAATPTAIGPGLGVADQLGAAPPAGPVRNTPAEDLDLVPPVAPRDRSSLDDYFDRLDAAFASLSTAPVPPSPAPDASARELPAEEPPAAETADARDADFVGPEPVSEAEPAPVEVAAAEGVPREAPLTGPQLFAALLDAEQGRGTAPALGAALFPPAPVMADDLADQVTKRVVERLADTGVRDVVERTVREVAERLVREEIDRLKAKIEESR